MLELRGLTRRYGEVVALDDLSFSVREGQMFGFVGPNGAGKTTAMRIVLGVLEPDAGEVRWRGHPVDAQTRQRMGYMPEERGLYPKMRVRDQLEYFARLHGLSTREAHDSASYWIERLGVAERAGDRVEQLSLGNQQRVQLAAALVHDPELCEAVAIINRGRLVATGAVAELRSSGRDHRYQIEVAGASGDWAGGLPGTTVIERRNGRVVLEVERDGDEQRVLDAARAAGRVIHFSAVEPTLADLFRQAVQA